VGVVLATDPGNLLHIGGPNPDQYPSTRRFCPGLARPVGSNLRFRFSGFSIYGHINIFYW